MSKVAGCHFVWDTNAVGVLDVVSIVYRQPHRLAIMITVKEAKGNLAMTSK